MVSLLIRMNERLAETEQALEKALKEKQGESTSHPPEEAPTSATSPPIGTTTLPPAIPASTTGTTTTDATTTPTTEQETSMKMEEMMKAVKELEAQMSELKDTKEKLAKLDVSYDKSKMIVVEKTREVKTLENKVKSLEKDLTLRKPLADIKMILWTKVGQSITDQ